MLKGLKLLRNRKKSWYIFESITPGTDLTPGTVTGEPSPV